MFMVLCKIYVYLNSCLVNLNLCSPFMFLLITPIVKNSHILAGMYSIFLKSVLDKTWKSLDTEFETQWKDRKSSYKVRKNLAISCNSVALILDWNYVKGIIVTKIVENIKFEKNWNKLETNTFFLLFMFLLTASIVKKVTFLLECTPSF